MRVCLRVAPVARTHGLAQRASSPGRRTFRLPTDRSAWSGSVGAGRRASPTRSISPELDALVVFHGDAPTPESDYERINAPVLDVYGDDLLTTATESPSTAADADSSFEVLVHDGVTIFLKVSMACHATC